MYKYFLIWKNKIFDENRDETVNRLSSVAFFLF